MSLQRRLPRHVLWDTLAYVNLDRSNGGIILNLNEDGMAVQAAAPVRVNGPVRIEFQLPGSITFLEATGEVSWAKAGQAGIRFLDLPQPERRSLREALFTSLLNRCAEARGAPLAPDSRTAAAQVPGVEPAPLTATQPAVGRSRALRQRESVWLLAGTAWFAAVFLLVADVPREASVMLLAGMAVPCALLAVLHQLVELQDR